MIKTHYDDGGYSGGNIERPALRQLLSDISDHKIDIIVVYKVDRLTRSLSDFAKMVELFDGHNVSFVSVTQQFNTTTSMGRLTLNVLLSFAQFEREVTGERIRDKIAASKKKGMWMGGVLSLGYDVQERKLIINPQEAKTVHMMFQRYLELGSVRLLQEEMVQKNIRSKTGKHPSRPGGKFMARGAIYKLLSNPIYIGQIRHKGVCHPGQHEPIIDQALWDQVQQRIAANAINRYKRSDKTTTSMLLGKLFDASGERLGPSHSVNRGKYYRYYVSQKLLTGSGKQGWRLPAQEIEQVIINAVKQMLIDSSAITHALHESCIAMHLIPAALHAAAETSKKLEEQRYIVDIISQIIKRVELLHNGIRLAVSLAHIILPTPIIITRDIPMLMKRRGIEMRLVIENDNAKATRADPILLKTIARAYGWSQELLSGKTSSMTEIASRNNVSVSYVKKLIPLAFLAPDIVEAIIVGRQPADLSSQKLIRQIGIPLEWKAQKNALGF